MSANDGKRRLSSDGKTPKPSTKTVKMAGSPGNRSVKVPLKAKTVQIVFSQMHQNYAKYIFETFTVDGITIAYQIESMA
jgi:hypothetical protein